MVKSDRPPANGFVAVARKVYNPIGFAKGYNFVLFFICFGGLMGFTLARLTYLDINGVFCGGKSEAIPGECFHYGREGSVPRIGIIIHLAGILPAAFLACWQFVPVIRHKMILLHRINGYIVILLSLGATAGCFMMARHAVGGAVHTQAVIGLLSISFIFCTVMAYINIKRLQIEQHRAWIMRAWVYAACIVTLRPTMAIINLIVDWQGGYFTTRPCEVIEYMVDDGDLFEELYPACEPYIAGRNPHAAAAVEAKLSDASSAAEAGAALEIAFVTAMVVAFFIHAFLVELYLHLTPAEAERLRHVSHARQLKAGMRHPGRAGLTSDRLGDAGTWTPKEEKKQEYEMLVHRPYASANGDDASSMI